MVGKVLVVDDEDTLRLTIKTRLSAGGFSADTAVDGEEALEKLKQGPFDVVLLDINMPRMDGITALGIISETYPNTDVIMLTGFADFTTAIECLKKGAKDYLVKPIDSTELITRMRSLLRARTSEAALENLRKQQTAYVFDEVLDPIIKVQGFIGVLSKEGGGKADQTAALASLQELSSHMLAGGRSIVSASKIAPDSLTLNIAEVSVEKMAESVFENGRILANAREIGFNSSIGGAVPKFECDAARFKAALLSMVMAVVDVSVKGAKLTAKLSKAEGAEKTLKVEVGTDKSGEKGKQVAGLFKTTLGSGSSNLGSLENAAVLLLAAKRIIQAHRGAMQVEYSEGGGLVVRCTVSSGKK